MPAPSLGRPRPVTETGLLRRLVGLSDPDAWEEFTGRYGPFLQRYLEHHGLSRDDALDIVQETFLEVVRRIGQFEYDRERSFGGWLATIAIRLAGRLYRAARTKPRDQRRYHRERTPPGDRRWFGGVRRVPRAGGDDPASRSGERQ